MQPLNSLQQAAGTGRDMQEYLEVTGIVLKQSPVKEYDRVITLLTRERGKISVFANGARKPGNRFTAATNAFAFGSFRVYEGKKYYTLAGVDIRNYFEEFRTDIVGACYGAYFAEFADYYAQENNDETEVLKLLYLSLRALTNEHLPDELVRRVFECKILIVNGEFPGVPTDMQLAPATVQTLEFIRDTPSERLYTFTVSDTVLGELGRICDENRRKIVGRAFKSLEVLKNLC